MTVAAVLGHEAQQQTHHEHRQVQAVGGGQRRVRPAFRHDRAGDHEGQHGADGAAGQDKVDQLRRGDLGLQRAEGDQRGVDGAGNEAQGHDVVAQVLRIVGADEQVHRAGGQRGQNGNDALQIEEAQDEAEHPHADHV